MASVTIKMNDELVVSIDELAKKQNITRSDFIRKAVKGFVYDEKLKYKGIPTEIIDKIAFLRLIVMEGTPNKDWLFMQEEVKKLWTSVQF